jgi:hypothetical protein
MRIIHLRERCCLIRLLGMAAAFCELGATLHGDELRGFVGYTSPHSNESIRKNFSPKDGGSITPVAIPEEKPAQPRLLSGTVYYMVFERDGANPGDPWGTGMDKFTGVFRAGIDFNGSSSPQLDTTAKYLYLYQVINDRQTTPPIESVSVKLLVNAQEITSWGYFQGAGFATLADRGDVRPLSATNKIDAKTYRSPAPALPVGAPLRITRVPTLRGEPEPKSADQIVQVTWDALDPALIPDYVLLLGSSDYDRQPSFRATWMGKNSIPTDGRSTIFGFTSNQPPKMESVRIRTTREFTKGYLTEIVKEKGKTLPKDATTGDMLRLAGLVGAGETGLDAEGELLGVEGQVPTPLPRIDLGGGIRAASNTSSQQSGGSFTPLSLPPQGGVGGGAPRVGDNAASSGFNFGTGTTGNGQGNGGGIFGGGGQTIFRQRARTEPTNEFNITITNQQSQSQHQSQGQKQSQDHHQGQHQRNKGGGGGGHVIPEPTSLLLGLLGLPGLAIFLRRHASSASPFGARNGGGSCRSVRRRASG